MSSVLLARLGGVPAFSMGSASPNQRNLGQESDSAQHESDRIFYSSLTLPNVSVPLNPPSTKGSEFTDSGDNGVLTGGGAGGSIAGAGEPSPVGVPSPQAATLALIGLVAIMRLRRGSLRD
jgi:hypothetical protein